ncbi:glycosyltransferase family 4 protein [Noviherbaspirillum aerium]|uniref:glycosyltransferase family 4 protein n=1 Tax=Noviherbaspirillum aerium TaxID=2588497 RepID=UPI00124CEDD3|nr:glycosyltransferase [Noviherbaspirillum aerium]
MTITSIQLLWPQLESGSDAQRYAAALTARLNDLGIAATGAAGPAGPCLAFHLPGHPAPQAAAGSGRRIDVRPGLLPLPPAASDEDMSGREQADAEIADMLPFLFDEQAFLADLPLPLAAREGHDGYAFVAFAAGLADDAQRLVRIRDHLVRLVKGPVSFAVAVQEGREEAALRKAGIDVLPTSGPACGRALQGADAILLDPLSSGQNLYASMLCQVPVVAMLAADKGFAGAGIGVADATDEELAGLLLLLATDPPIRRRTLDGQQALLQAHGEQAQRAALVRWLAQHDIEAPHNQTTPATPSAEAFERPLCRVEGVFDSSYSLAIVNRQLAMALEDIGERVALFTYEQGPAPAPNFHAVEQPQRIEQMWKRSEERLPPGVSMRNAWPPVVRDMRGARRVLANYAWEETAFPEKYAEGFNQTLDLITVVSSQTAKVLRDAGVRTPMAIVGNGVDHLFDVVPAPPPRVLPGGFRFLHVSSCFPRKGVDVLLKAYGEVFRNTDDVSLIIKTFPNPHNDVAQQLAALRASDPAFPRVELIEEDWTGEQIVGLYHACQVLVAPSRGEGFGLPVAEAMLHRLPVITTAWGGQLDFANDETVWLVDYNPELAQTHIDLPGSLWAEPSVESLKQRLRELHTLSPQERERKTARAREYIAARYTWRQAAERTMEALAAINAQPAPLPPPRIGWVSTWGSRCGIAAYSSHLSAAFPSTNLRVYTPVNETVEMPDGANVVRNWTLGTGQLPHVIEQAIAEKLDAIVIQFNWAFMSLAALSELVNRLTDAGIKVFVFFHNTSSSIAETLADHRAALSRCERLIVHAVGDVQRLKKWGYHDNVTLLPLGVYPVALPDEAARATLRQRLRLTRKKLLVTYGFLMPHKGLSVMVEAMPRLIAAHPDLHLLMVNAFYSEEASGAELRHIQKRIAELKLGDHVTLQTDFLPEEESLAMLSLADLIAFPYQHSEESSSAAVRMALVAERPVAITPLPIFGDVASSCGVLPGTDADALAKGVDALLRELGEGNRAQEYIGKAKAYVDRHNTRRLSRRLYNLIEGCVTQARLEAD